MAEVSRALGLLVVVVAEMRFAPWDERGLRFHVNWTRGFIRDFGVREYVRVVWIDAWKYRLMNWRCWFGHDLGPEEESYESFVPMPYECWRYCQRPKCEYCERCD